MLPLFVAYVAVVVTSLTLSVLNLRHVRKHGHHVPSELAGTIDGERLKKISAYTADRARLGILSSLLSSVLLVVFVFGGLLERYDAWIASLTDSFIGSGVLFFLGLSWAESVLGLPLSLYGTFKVEARHGFNRMTPALFWADWIKGVLLSTLLLGLAAAGALALISVAPQSWWAWVWAFFVLLSLALTFAAPYVIEPLFFKMEPLKVEGLVDEVQHLASRAGVQVKRVLTMDASRRSAHSNAYFTGIGRVKRVVLFDTLLEQLTHREILSVLSHELGHWRKHHIVKRIVAMHAVALGLCFIAFKLTAWEALPSLIGASSASFPARILILAVLGSIASFAFTPLSSYWSRKHEWEADRYATELWGAPVDLANALTKLTRENLANLHPHPLYAKFYYSHPPVIERVRALHSLDRNGAAAT